MMSNSPYENVCAISVKKWSAQTKQLDGTGSGILIDSSHGLVLTHASILNPFVSLIKPSKLSSFVQNGVLLADGFQEQLLFDVFLPSARSSENDIKSNGTAKYRPELLNCNLQEGEKSYISYPASLKIIFVCKALKTCLVKLVPKESWQFANEVHPSLNSTDDSEKKSRELETLYYHLLPCFVLLKIKDWCPMDNASLIVRPSIDNKQGDSVEICASPFGALSPEIFLNNHSRGIISNLAGSDQVLILTDARCIPGSEGGALFYCRGNDRVLTGIMVASLCWKNNEWIGLSFACAVSEVMSSLTRSYMTSRHITGSEAHVSYNSEGFQTVSLTKPLLSLVPLISVGRSWGSGVILDSQTGLVLTCSHVVKEANRLKVLVHDLPSADKEVATVICRNRTSGQFDLAVLQVPSHHTADKPSLKISEVKEGEAVYVIGHGLFGLEHALSPTVTAGIVSKVITLGRIAVMIQTTCAVHAGASGGAVFNKQGHLVAIVVCNSKDTISGSSYPHVNMCVPIATVAPILQKYMKQKDADVLSALYINSPRLHQIWTIGTQATGFVSSQL